MRYNVVMCCTLFLFSCAALLDIQEQLTCLRDLKTPENKTENKSSNFTCKNIQLNTKQIRGEVNIIFFRQQFQNCVKTLIFSV